MVQAFPGGDVQAMRDYLIPLASTRQSTGFATYAAMTLLFYDWILCLDQEVPVIWRARWSWPKALYVLVRLGSTTTMLFLGICFNLPKMTSQYCKIIMMFEGVAGCFEGLPPRILMMLRVSALYGHSKKVLYSLIAILAFQVLANEVVVFIQFVLLKTLENPMNQPIPGLAWYLCHPVREAQYLWLYWLCALVFDISLVVLIITKGVKSYREGLGSSLLRLVLRDSLLYYLALFVTEVVTMVLWARNNGTEFQQMQAGTAFVVAIEPILCCRLVLNMNTSARSGQHPTLSSTIQVASDRHGNEIFRLRNKGRAGLDSMGYPKVAVSVVITKEEEDDYHPSRASIAESI